MVHTSLIPCLALVLCSYLLSVARKIGAFVFLKPRDVLSGQPQLMLMLLVALMARDRQLQAQAQAQEAGVEGDI